METEDIIKLSASQDSGTAVMSESGCEANIADSLPLNSEVKDEIIGEPPISLSNGELETIEKPIYADAKQNAESKSSAPVELEFSESVSVVERLVSVSTEHFETECLDVQNESSYNDHEPDKSLISDKGRCATSTSTLKRPRAAVDEQLPSVRVDHSLTRESKQKLEELLQQWSQWHSENRSSPNLSQGSDVELFTGEGTYFPALSVGLNKPSAVRFWFDNQPNKQSDMEVDASAVPHYDRGYAFALTGDGNLNRGAEVNTSRCFNCGSYSHALKDCPKPRDSVAVNNARKEHKSRKGHNAFSRNSIRYYQSHPKGKYDGLTPGVLHAETRRLLGLGELDPPPWLNRMREVGYPPGYLEIDNQPSGIMIFGEEANNVGDEEGEILDASGSEPPRKMTVKFPGINAPVPENADVRIWSQPSSIDVPSDRLQRRVNHTSENHSSRGSFENHRWSTDYRDDFLTPGSDRITYNYSSEWGHHSEKRWVIDSEDDDDGPPGCEPGTSPSLANHFRRYQSSSPRYSFSIPLRSNYGRYLAESSHDDLPFGSSFSPRNSSSILRSPGYGRSWSDSSWQGSYSYSSPRW